MANVAADGVANGEEDVLAAIRPDAIVVAVLQPLLEEGRHVALLRRVALRVQADGLALLRAVHARLARGPQIGRAPNGRGAFDLALQGNRVSVDEGDVAVGGAGGGEEALELGVAAAGVGLRADEHGAAGAVVRGEAHFLGSAAPGAAAAPGGGVGVGPGGVVVREVDALLRDGGCRVGNIAFDTGVGHGSAVSAVMDHSGAADRCEKGQTGLVSELHF